MVSGKKVDGGAGECEKGVEGAGELAEGSI
jgi:hypothetical protein